MLQDWSQALVQGSQRIDDAFRYVHLAFLTFRLAAFLLNPRLARNRGASRNVPFLDVAFDVARVFRVNVEHVGDVADTTEFSSFTKTT